MDAEMRRRDPPDWIPAGSLGAALLGCGVLIVTLAAALGNVDGGTQAEPMDRQSQEAALLAAMPAAAGVDCPHLRVEALSSRSRALPSFSWRLPI
jgi:hypothetical protein